MVYRKAVLLDVETLVVLRIEMLCEDSYLTDEQREIISENTKQFFEDGLKDDSVVCWVAAQEGSVIGMGCVNFFCFPPNDWCPNGKTGYIGNVYTLPDFRGRGVASEIVLRLENEAKARKCQRILLHATKMGRKLYEKNGFVNSEDTMVLYPFGIASLDNG